MVSLRFVLSRVCVFLYSLGPWSFRCLLRSDWAIAQLVQQNRLDNRTSCTSFSPDFHVSGTFERHVTRYDWPIYRAIGRLRAGESYRVAAPLVPGRPHHRHREGKGVRPDASGNTLCEEHDRRSLFQIYRDVQFT